MLQSHLKFGQMLGIAPYKINKDNGKLRIECTKDVFLYRLQHILQAFYLIGGLHYIAFGRDPFISKVQVILITVTNLGLHIVSCRFSWHPDSEAIQVWNTGVKFEERLKEGGYIFFIDT